MPGHGRRRRPYRCGSRSSVPAGGVLDVGAAETAGLRTYVLVAGGFDVPPYLGSASTFTLGRFGGHGGRPLVVGDVLRAAPSAPTRSPVPRCPPSCGRRCRRSGNWRSPRVRTARRSSSPATTSTRCSTRGYRRALQLGPHRRAARGPAAASGRAPTAARRDCTRRTSTTTPIRLARSTSPATPRSCSAPTVPASAASSARSPSSPPTGGSSGSCARVTRCGSCPIRAADAPSRARVGHQRVGAATPVVRGPAATVTTACSRRRAGDGAPAVTYRRSGDDNVLVEYGDMVLDLALRARVHALHERLADARGRCRAGHPRPHAGNPVAAGARRPRRAADRPAARPAVRARGRPARHLGTRRAEPVGPAAADLGRPRDPGGDRALHLRGARRRAVVPVEHRIHPPGQRFGVARTTSWTPCSRRSTSRSASATSTSARPSPPRSIRGTGWSPPSTTRPAPGPRRTRSASAARTCASTAWRGPAATSSSVAPRRCGAGIGTPRRSSRAARGCCASSTASPGIRCSAEELLDLRADLAAGRGSVDITDGHVLARRARTVPRRQRRVDRGVPGRAGRGVRRRARGVGGGRRVRPRRTGRVPGRAANHRSGARRRRTARRRAVLVECVEGRRRGRRAGGGRAGAAGVGGDEDGDRADRTVRRRRHARARRGGQPGGPGHPAGRGRAAAPTNATRRGSRHDGRRAGARGVRRDRRRRPAGGLDLPAPHGRCARRRRGGRRRGRWRAPTCRWPDWSRRSRTTSTSPVCPPPRAARRTPRRPPPPTPPSSRGCGPRAPS